MYSIDITISEFSNRNAIYKTRYIRTKLKNLESICNAVDKGMFRNDMFYISDPVIADVFKQILYEDALKSFSITLMYSKMKTTSMILFITAVKQTNDEIIAII